MQQLFSGLQIFCIGTLYISDAQSLGCINGDLSFLRPLGDVLSAAPHRRINVSLSRGR